MAAGRDPRTEYRSEQYDNENNDKRFFSPPKKRVNASGSRFDIVTSL